MCIMFVYTCTCTCIIMLNNIIIVHYQHTLCTMYMYVYIVCTHVRCTVHVLTMLVTVKGREDVEPQYTPPNRKLSCNSHMYIHNIV